jgi:hypothetical protein
MLCQRRAENVSPAQYADQFLGTKYARWENDTRSTPGFLSLQPASHGRVGP